jgi:hypothetical protein
LAAPAACAKGAKMVDNLNQLPEHVKDQAVTNRDLYHILKSFTDSLKI